MVKKMASHVHVYMCILVVLVTTCIHVLIDIVREETKDDRIYIHHTCTPLSFYFLL